MLLTVWYTGSCLLWVRISTTSIVSMLRKDSEKQTVHVCKKKPNSSGQGLITHDRKYSFIFLILWNICCIFIYLTFCFPWQYQCSHIQTPYKQPLHCWVHKSKCCVGRKVHFFSQYSLQYSLGESLLALNVTCRLSAIARAPMLLLWSQFAVTHLKIRHP